MNKIIEVKKLLDEKANTNEEYKVITPASTPDNLTPLMKPKINKIETQIKSKLPAFADDSAIKSQINHNKRKQDPLSFKKDLTTIKNVENVTINPSSYLLRDGSINFSKLLIDEVLAADKLLVEAAKLSYDIAGNA